MFDENFFSYALKILKKSSPHFLDGRREERKGKKKEVREPGEGRKEEEGPGERRGGQKKGRQGTGEGGGGAEPKPSLFLT